MRSILKVEKLAVAVVQPELSSKAYLSSRMCGDDLVASSLVEELC